MKPKNLRNPEITALPLLEHFDATMSLNKAIVLAEYRKLVEVRNAVVHSGGIVRNYNKPKVLKKAVDDLKGFSIANWHFLGECVQIDRGALDLHIESMAQLLSAIYQMADEKELLKVLTGFAPRRR